MALNNASAHFDNSTATVIVDGLVISHKDVVREAQRWTTGQRGPVVDDPDELAQADLTRFVTQAIVIGSHALAATAQASDARALEQMVKDVGDRTTEATARAADLTERAAKAAAETVSKVAVDAKKAIIEADRQSRTEFVAAVDGAKKDLTSEVRRLFGGENPELLDRLQPLLDRFGTDLDTKVRAGTVEMLEKAAKQFDPADPSSPMARHTAALTAQQERVTQQLQKNHTELEARFDALTTTLRLNDERTRLARVTPIKGSCFEGQIHDLMRGIAAGLGDEYQDTTTTVGRLPRSKKGDGVLNVEGGSTRVVLEMTDSPRATWGDYLDEAERNRAAIAAIGVVRTPDQNAGQSIRVLGTRRVVIAFDPDHDDPEFLRTAVLLLRTVAIVAASRTGEAEIATAEEKINAALDQLSKIDSIKRLAEGIQKSAGKIESDCTGISATIHRLLDEALVALGGAPSTSPRESAEPGAA
jgi:hypothetical protein